MEKVKLGDIVHYSKERINNSELNASSYVGVANILPDRAGIKDSEVCPTEGTSTRFNNGDVLIGNIRPYLRKIWLADRTGGASNEVLVLEIKDKEQVLSEYLYYILALGGFFEYANKYVTVGSVPRGNKKKVLDYKISVPALDEQKKTIEVLSTFANFLDTFTELIDTLKAELDLREKQFAWVREILISSVECVAKKVKLEDVCEVIVGGDVPKGRFSKELTSIYQVPIISNGVGDNALYGYTDFPIVDKESVTISARGTIGYSEHRDYPYYPIIRLICLIPKEGLLAKYLNYQLQTVNFVLPESGIKQLTTPTVKNIKVKIPELKTQKYIVEILDTFTELIATLEQELDLRQKQYEYYRNLLMDGV